MIIARQDGIIHIPWWKATTVVADEGEELGRNGCVGLIVVDVLAISDSEFPVMQRLLQLFLGPHLG
jgi:hypothetical protein